MLTCDFTPQNATTSSTHLPPTPPHPTELNDNGRQAEPPSNSEANENGRQTEQESNSDSSNPSGFVHRKLSLTVTCFVWLPALVKTELNGKATNLALVAMATRLGHVILMGVEVPLDSGW